MSRFGFGFSAVFVLIVLSGTILNAEMHPGVDSCAVCHYSGAPLSSEASACLESDNLKMVRKEINTPNSGTKPVVFESRPADFADGDSTYDGICEVCHTQTPVHDNDGDGVGVNHFDGSDCMTCHAHSQADGTVLFSARQEDGPQSHHTHIHGGAGPGLGCLDCHYDHTDYTKFLGDVSLAETPACDTCHSEGGTYDGVAMAKANWVDAVYEADGTAVQSGKEEWCATCHDEEPAEIYAVSAPKVIGDEGAVTPYGTGYGFYTTGHGLSTSETYPATGTPGAGLGCLDCHDAGMLHTDGIARSYYPDSDYETYHPVSLNYQEGYRLKDVSTGYDAKYPMHLPRTGHNYASQGGPSGPFEPGFRE
ncbi:MAG TPA: hypothetical protein EYP19_04820, partial [Desulfobacterales bacterium]|nr:hypothetical protein [Desulfobacterales bacterium]